jgi:hypothetical protein
MSDLTTVQEQDQQVMLAESVDTRGILSQNPTNDGLISVEPADKILSDSQHELQLAGGGTQVSGGNPSTMTKEVSMMVTETDDGPTR